MDSTCCCNVCCYFYESGHILIDTHTRGREEGPGQPAVSGDLSYLCGDIDESTDHWRDPVKAQQSEKEKERYTKKTKVRTESISNNKGITLYLHPYDTSCTVVS